MSTTTQISGSTTTNYYRLIKPPKVHNPNFGKTHKIQVNFRAGVIGSSGSGKTNLVLDLIHRFSYPKGTFKDIIVYLRCRDEPLYNYISEQLKDAIELIEVRDALDIKDLDLLDDSTLVIFDDLILAEEPVQKKIGEYFIRGRKKGISCIYISQNFYSIPKVIRGQFGYIFLKKIGSSRDLNMILKEFPLDVNIKELKKLYLSASIGLENSFYIDVNKNEFYKNFQLIDRNTVLALEEEPKKSHKKKDNKALAE